MMLRPIGLLHPPVAGQVMNVWRPEPPFGIVYMMPCWPSWVPAQDGRQGVHDMHLAEEHLTGRPHSAGYKRAGCGGKRGDSGIQRSLNHAKLSAGWSQQRATSTREH